MLNRTTVCVCSLWRTYTPAAGLVLHLFHWVFLLNIQHVSIRAAVCTTEPLTSEPSVSSTSLLPLLFTPYILKTPVTLSHRRLLCYFPWTSLCHMCSFSETIFLYAELRPNSTAGWWLTDFGHFQFTAEKFGVKQIAFHFSPQHLNGLSRYFLVQNAILQPCHRLAYSLLCTQVHCSFLAAFYEWQEWKILQNYKYSPDLMCAICRHIPKWEWQFSFFSFVGTYPTRVRRPCPAALLPEAMILLLLLRCRPEESRLSVLWRGERNPGRWS